MTTNRLEILKQIASISKLTSSDSGAFQGEISNAAALIQKLMDKYSITQDEVSAVVAEDNKKAQPHFTNGTSKYRVHGLAEWHWSLAAIIARITHTKEYFGVWKKQGTAKFFGDQANVEIATALFAEWVQIIMAMCESAVDDHWQVLIKKYDYPGFLKRKKEGYETDRFMDYVPYEERTTYFKPSWYKGCIAGMWRSVLEQEAERDKQTSNAIVLYKEELENQYKQYSLQTKMKTVDIKKTRIGSGIGYQQGYETGKQIRLGLDRLKR